ncbi:hypothetical protein HJFPF1_01246 [Paramyrothecium foliicola]|nr:hypothetical protein HJFPF1_01246 [Paramyrothecium foliicola]
MALEAPLRSSTGNHYFPFAKQEDMSGPADNEPYRSPFRVLSSPPPATDSSLLRPSSVNRVSSNSMHIMSPSDIVGPSPVTSNGTETTEIEDDASEEIDVQSENGSVTRRSELLMLTTNLPDNVRQSNSEETISVIHAPESFINWAGSESGTSQNQRSAKSSPRADDASLAALNGIQSRSPETPSRPPLSTDVKPVRYNVDSATPRAQDMQDLLSDGSRLRSSSTSSLEKIDEQTEAEGDDDDEDYISQVTPLRREHDEVSALRAALQECWTLCNTLANLSSIHRARVFNNSGTPDAHEKAWKTCWKLCQRLYDNQDESMASLTVRMNLDLCRDFCQALFDVRQRKDEAADSVLRVSFELNNHLYSAQDSRNLPEAFRERTLDFYITLCHRLMKQRSDQVEETDQLLRACWSLAEMLLSLRQNSRDSKTPDVELLGSAVQACWDLCDIFRNGWTQVRPERNTPRPNQTSFFPYQASEQTGRESRQSNRSSLHSKRESTKSSRQEERPRQPLPVPETPVTEFEDTPISPESRSPQMPNIMVLGTTSDNGRGGRWSSSASNLSSYSHSSTRTSSTATTTANTEDPNITRCKVLVLRAAMNLGFSRENVTDPKSGSAMLQKFVHGLPSGSFGSSSSHATLLQQYKNSVLTDAIIPRSQSLPAHGKRVSAYDMVKSIHTMSKTSARYAYLRELFKFVFQFPLEEVDSRRNVSIVV